MPILMPSLRRFFWTGYDHLGGLILINLAWSALNLPWMCMAYAALVLGFQGLSTGAYTFGMTMVLLGLEALFLSPPTAGLFAVSCAYVAGGDTGVRTMVAAIRRHFWSAQVLGVGTMGLTALLLLSVHFYSRLPGALRGLGLILSGAMGSIVLLMVLIATFLFPILVSRETGIRGTLQYGVLLVLGNLPTALGALFLTCILLTLGILSGAGFFFGAVAAGSLFLNVVFAEIGRQHHRGLSVEEPEEAETKRSWRELIRPWEI